MAELLDRVLSPEVMNRAWRGLKQDRAQWMPGVSRASIEKDWVLHLMRLMEEVRAGEYQPAGLRRFTIAKADGGKRVLSALTLRDKLVQKACQIVLDPLAERLFSNDSYAYRRGRSVEMAVSKAKERVLCGLDWLVDADIRTFFDAIPHGALRKVLRELVKDKDLLRLLDRWLAVGCSHQSLFGRRRGIPQGAILSPLFCNLYLNQMDRLWDKQNIQFVRFADDFLLFAPDQKRAEQMLRYTEKQLSKLGLELHDKKTRVCHSGDKVIFLGKKLSKRRW
ncbi:MAG: reverse transcriptase/maturase family protein [Gammaproteobacteria bacterium]|nr:reverse transcriptase/maturase family protein [Gammaproteobacteria bacterium]MDQ7075112.1 reverse transcriptase/maturase family protein [Gammaproteobacteria bacterium]